MPQIDLVITNCGDGSNGLEWVTDPEVIALMEERADDGVEFYSSGDGLQVRTLKFPEGFDLDAWLKLNRITVTDIDNVSDY